MSLRDDMALYTELSGNDGNHTPIGIIGAYLDGYEKGKVSAQPEIIRCKDCKYNVSSHKCLHPESFFLVPDDDFYCGYAERRTDE